MVQLAQLVGKVQRDSLAALVPLELMESLELKYEILYDLKLCMLLASTIPVGSFRRTRPERISGDIRRICKRPKKP